jgi:hypothetical protein
MARALNGFFLKKKPHCKLFASAREFRFCSQAPPNRLHLELDLRTLELALRVFFAIPRLHSLPALIGDLSPSAECFTCRVLRILPDFLWNCKEKRIDRRFLIRSPSVPVFLIPDP